MRWSGGFGEHAIERIHSKAAIQSQWGPFHPYSIYSDYNDYNDYNHHYHHHCRNDRNQPGEWLPTFLKASRTLASMCSFMLRPGRSRSGIHLFEIFNNERYKLKAWLRWFMVRGREKERERRRKRPKRQKNLLLLLPEMIPQLKTIGIFFMCSAVVNVGLAYVFFGPNGSQNKVFFFIISSPFLFSFLNWIVPFFLSMRYARSLGFLTRNKWLKARLKSHNLRIL